MNLQEYIDLVERENAEVRKTRFRLSDAKKKALERLWGEGEPEFPRGWVSGRELHELMDQSDFGRRLRELGDEEGCDIQKGSFGYGRSSYRLNSLHVRPNPRLYLSQPQKTALFRSQGYECQICGKRLDPEGEGRTGAQADHKIPLKRRGTHERTNWQTICTECNVGKRRACENCLEDCLQCPWAFPEKFGAVISVGLSRELYRAALEQTERRTVPEVGKLLADALRDRLAKE